MRVCGCAYIFATSHSELSDFIFRSICKDTLLSLKNEHGRHWGHKTQTDAHVIFYTSDQQYFEWELGLCCTIWRLLIDMLCSKLFRAINYLGQIRWHQWHFIHHHSLRNRTWNDSHKMLIFLVHVNTTKTVLTVPRLLGTDFDHPPVLYIFARNIATVSYYS